MVDATILCEILIDEHFAVALGCHLKEMRECIEVSSQCLLLNLFIKIYAYIAAKSLIGILHHIMSWYHTIVDGTIEIKVWNLATDERVHLLFCSSTSQQVRTKTFQFSCARTA